MIRSIRYFFVAAIGLLAAGHASLAADTPVAPAAGVIKPSDASGLETIVVTAQKRAEVLRRVPLAVTAFTAKARQVIGIETLSDYANFTPGVTYGADADRVFIRGVGRQTNTVGSDPGVATYSDGVYNAGTGSIAGDELFLDRTEILRGPQGTLYGRNSIGGAINAISRHPTDTFYAEARATFANYGANDFEAAESGPVTDHLRIRLAALRDDQQNGYFKNTVNGTTEGGRGETYYIEGQVAFDVTPDLTGWLKLFTGGNSGRPYTSNLIDNYDYTPFNTLSPLSPSSAFGLLIPGATQSGAGFVNPGKFDPRQFSNDINSTSRTNDNFGITAHLDYETSWAHFKYIGGYQQSNYDSRTDLDGTDVTSYSYPLSAATICPYVPGCTALKVHPSQQFDFGQTTRFTSQELDANSVGQGPLQWIAGLYYYGEHTSQTDQFAAPDQSQLRAPANGPANPSGDYVSAAGRIRTNSYAGFGQLDWNVTPQVRLTGGVRYTYDEKAGVEDFRELCFALPACGVDPSIYGSLTPALDITASPTVISYAPAPGVSGAPTIDAKTGIASRLLSANWSAVTGAAGIAWTPDPQTLAYLNYSRGYKSGGFNAGAIIAAPETNPEYVNAYQAGIKKRITPVLETDGAIFYYDYTGLQVPLTYTPATGVPLTEFANVPKARSFGAELEVAWEPVSNLRFFFSYGYLNATIRKSSTLIDLAAPERGATAVGQSLPDSPRNKVALNTAYSLPFLSGTLTLSGSLIWKDNFYGYLYNRPYNEASSYSQVDLRTLWTDSRDRYTVILFARNLLNSLGYDDPVLPTGTAPTGPQHYVDLTPPRTFGVQLQYRFR